MKEDILMRKQLDDIKENHGVRVNLCVDKAEKGWDGYEGFVNLEMLKLTMFPPSEDTLTLLCGPFLMLKLVSNLLINQMGHKEHHVYRF